MSVTRFGVSAENVVATIETPSNHQGILLPERKKLFTLLPAVLLDHSPIKSVTRKNPIIIVQSINSSFIH